MRGRMWLADGNPCTAAYRELDYSGLLAKVSPVGRPRRAPINPCVSDSTRA